MNTVIHRHLAALNAAWQRYVRTMEAQQDPVTMEGLSRDYLAAWEGLDACGIAEWMLVYDPITLTFSLPATGVSHDAFATVPILAVTPGRSEAGKPMMSPTAHGDRNVDAHTLLLLLIPNGPVWWKPRSTGPLGTAEGDR